MFGFGKKKKTISEILSDYYICKKAEFDQIVAKHYDGKVLINKMYDFDNLYAYEVLESNKDGDNIKITLTPKPLVGKVRFCVNTDNPQKESSYRFSQMVDGDIKVVFKKNELLFTADKLGE